MRKAFGILQTLVIMLLVAGLMTMVLKYASIGAKHTQDSYIREQAQLWLESSVEWALFQMQKEGGRCWAGGDAPTLTQNGVVYTSSVQVEKYYLYNETCSLVDTTAIFTAKSQYYVMLRVEVNATLDAEPHIRLLRRTLQRL